MTGRASPNLFLDLQAQVRALNETVWEGRVNELTLNNWLAQFERIATAEGLDADDAQLDALFLATRVVYFGLREIKEMLRAIYRDCYKYTLIRPILEAHAELPSGERNAAVHAAFVNEHLDKTRFSFLGNPAESSAHLLYYFRQVNALDSRLFVDISDLYDFESREWTSEAKSLRHLVLIDDLCGSGRQAVKYASRFSAVRTALPELQLLYFPLVATSTGLTKAVAAGVFHRVECVHELDSSYSAFGDNPRIFRSAPDGVDLDRAKSLWHRIGTQLSSSAPLGFEGMSLLLAFHHNTPNNTLPPIWHQGSQTAPWQPIFRRFPKPFRRSRNG